MSVDVHARHRRRPRPSGLDLHLAKNADLALRIVLPGIPPQAITEEGSHTLRMSHQIQRQQRQIIALMNQARDAQLDITTPPDDGDGDGDDNTDNTTTTTTTKVGPVVELEVLQHDASDDSHDTPTLANKRLKRDNVPTPLNIGLINDKHPQPLIHLAPIRPAMRGAAVPPPRRRPGPQIRRVYRPFPNTHVTYQAYPQEYALPYFAGPQWTPYPPPTAYPPPYPVAIRRRPLATPKRPNLSDKVTDVYHGDYTRAAPLLLQPLLAQREVFDLRSQQRFDEDRLPVLEDEVREMQAKYDQGTVTKPNTNEVFGSISLMNQLVYNFRIFRKSTLETATDKTESLELTLKVKQEPSDTIPEHDEDDTKEQELEVDWLRREKKKFLRICETLWDTFVDNRTKFADKK